jgi:hypothetical protein
MIDEVDPSPVDVEVLEPVRDHLVDGVGHRAGGLDAGRPGSDDHEVQRASIDEGRVVVGVLEHAHEAICDRAHGTGFTANMWFTARTG